MTTLNKRQAVALVSKYAQAQPERYAQARYTDRYDHTIPECIVGQVAINDLGIPGEVLSDTYARASDALDRNEVTLTSGAALFLDTVQALQDGRGAWIDGEHVANSGGRRTWVEAVPLALTLTKGKRQ